MEPISTTIVVAGVVIFIMEKIAGEEVKQRYNKFKGKAFPKENYESRLKKAINDAIFDYQAVNNISDSIGKKFYFFESEEFLKNLVAGYFFGESGLDFTNLPSLKNPNILPYTDGEIAAFLEILDEKVKEDRHLPDLFIDENANRQVFENTALLKLIMSHLESKDKSNERGPSLMSPLSVGIEERILIDLNNQFSKSPGKPQLSIASLARDSNIEISEIMIHLQDMKSKDYLDYTSISSGNGLVWIRPPGMIIAKELSD